jgi:hypothetical protein
VCGVIVGKGAKENGYIVIYWYVIMKLVQRADKRKSEVIMILSGVAILVSVAVFMSAGGDIFWKFAKILYAFGVLLILFDR